MSAQTHPTDLELAALISSKICHDVIGPVGAIGNGLEILDEDESRDTKSYALEVVRNVTTQAIARLEFHRMAFGASGSAGSSIEVDHARKLSAAYVGDGKHNLAWSGPAGYMGKDLVKLLLNLVASSVSALPRGGKITVAITGSLENPSFEIECEGRGARGPNFLTDLVAGKTLEDIDAMSIQAYYTWRLADLAGRTIKIEPADGRVVIRA